MIPLSWSTPSSIPNIEQLAAQVKAQGGKVIEYRLLFSFILLTLNHPKFVWVPESGSRPLTGLKYALLCAVTGWWSIAGLFVTPVLVLNNLLGGIDVTKILFPDTPDGTIPREVLLELEKAQKRQQLVFLGYVLLILALVVWFCVIPYV